MTNINFNFSLFQRVFWPGITRLFQKGIFLVLALLLASEVYGQVVENIPKNDTKSVGEYKSEKPKKFRVGFISIAGVGFNKIPLGETDAGDKVTISAGGGIGMGFDMGYVFNPSFELSVAYTYKMTDLSMVVENGSGSFEYGNLMVTGKFMKKVKKRSSLNFGGGLDLFNAGTMDIDLSQVPDGARYVYRYKTAVGCHVLAEFQFRFAKKWSLTAGSNLYGVNYNQLKSFEVNSVSIPTDLVGTDFQTLKGSGADLYAKISFHF
jgi:hypothetical protein